MVNKTIHASCLLVATLFFAATALADPGHGNGQGHGNGKHNGQAQDHGNHNGHDQDHGKHKANGKGSCVVACVSSAHDCVRAARDVRRVCVTPCAPLAMAAEQACGENEDAGDTGDDDEGGVTPTPTATPTGDCTAAEQALNECVQPCRTAYRAAMKACKQTFRSCLNAQCGIAPRPTATP